MTGRCFPLTLALSPEGRGNGVAHDGARRTLFLRRSGSCGALFPLPPGERARVRGALRQRRGARP